MANLGDKPYWQNMADAAKDVLSYPEDERDEQLDSWADSYSIYTSDALTILRETDNDDAVLEVYGIPELAAGLDSIAALYCRIAWFAVRQDIADEMAKLPDDDEDEQDDDENEWAAE